MGSSSLFKQCLAIAAAVCGGVVLGAVAAYEIIKAKMRTDLAHMHKSAEDDIEKIKASAHSALQKVENIPGGQDVNQLAHTFTDKMKERYSARQKARDDSKKIVPDAGLQR